RQQSLHGADPERLGRLQSDVHEQLVSWFGGTADDYEFVRSYYITHALPTPNLQSVMQPIVSGRRFVCGDHRETPSIQGAMNSGLRTADAVMSSL
ncbi:MAG: oxidoreductase, partial [Planctomycetota bacterium]